MTVILQKISLIFFLSLITINVQAAEIQKILLHVASSNRASHKAALINAASLQEVYGKENVIIEIVANGTGVSIANSRNVFKNEVKQLMGTGITLSVCNVSLKKLQERDGVKMQLVEGVNHVKSGIIRVIELQKQGYIYVRP